MKKLVCILFSAVMLFTLASCGQANGKRGNVVNQGNTVDSLFNDSASGGQTNVKSDGDSATAQDGGNYDVDLTTLNSIMVYSEVNNMMTYPENYVGKTVKMNGSLSVYEGDERNYYACLIADATACCAQGIEFVLSENVVYPPLGSDITVVGVFDTYYEGDYLYCQLIDAKFV